MFEKKTDSKVEEPEIHVEDRRFWARADRGESDDGPAASRQPAYVEDLESRLQAAEQRRDEVLSAHRRMQSEFDDFRARLNRDVESRILQGKASSFRRFLEVADHLELALQAAGAQDAGLIEGVKLIHDQFVAALREEGVERLELVGRPFDPEQAEAVAVVPVEDAGQHDQVVAELRPGYRLQDLTLRPAQVQVGRHDAGGPGEKATASGESEPDG